MRRTPTDTTLNPDEFTSALVALGWKQTDFAKRTGLSLSAVNRWATGQAPAPLWATAYLGAMLDLAALHSKYLAPLQSSKGAGAPASTDDAAGPPAPPPARLAHLVPGTTSQAK